MSLIITYHCSICGTALETVKTERPAEDVRQIFFLPCQNCFFYENFFEKLLHTVKNIEEKEE